MTESMLQGISRNFLELHMEVVRLHFAMEAGERDHTDWYPAIALVEQLAMFCDQEDFETVTAIRRALIGYHARIKHAERMPESDFMKIVSLCNVLCVKYPRRALHERVEDRE